MEALKVDVFRLTLGHQEFDSCPTTTSSNRVATVNSRLALLLLTPSIRDSTAS